MFANIFSLKMGYPTVDSCKNNVTASVQICAMSRKQLSIYHIEDRPFIFVKILSMVVIIAECLTL